MKTPEQIIQYREEQLQKYAATTVKKIGDLLEWEYNGRPVDILFDTFWLGTPERVIPALGPIVESILFAAGWKAERHGMTYRVSAIEGI